MRRFGWLSALVILTCLILSGCTGGEAAHAKGSPSANETDSAIYPVNSCTHPPAGWRRLDHVPVSAVVAGTGPAVVFANDSGNTVCGWFRLARQLATSGYRVALFAYADTTPAAEPQALRDTLAVAAATAGAGRHFALIGASLGGRIAIEAAAEHTAGLTAIVCLSAPLTVGTYRSILAEARQVDTPTLYTGARDDPIIDGARQPVALHRAMHGRPNELLEVAGWYHGTELIDPTVNGGSKTIITHITAFLKQNLN